MADSSPSTGPDLAERDVRSIADGYLGRQHEYESIASELLRRRRENRDLRAENERLRELADEAQRRIDGTSVASRRSFTPEQILAALAGSPAANEEQQ